MWWGSTLAFVRLCRSPWVSARGPGRGYRRVDDRYAMNSSVGYYYESHPSSPSMVWMGTQTVDQSVRTGSSVAMIHRNDVFCATRAQWVRAARCREATTASVVFRLSEGERDHDGDEQDREHQDIGVK